MGLRGFDRMNKMNRMRAWMDHYFKKGRELTVTSSSRYPVILFILSPVSCLSC
jgi:hypothetical protein